MIIKHAHIEQFRALKNLDFDLGRMMTVIVGHNGTMKTTILGILSQTFTISKDNPMVGEKTIDGYNFHSQFSEKFKFSDKDIAGDHKWRLDLYDGIYKSNYFEAKSIYRDKKTNKIRFWSTEGRGVSMNYPQVPVYYISLKRVTPIGEEKKVNVESVLSEDEKNFLVNEYKTIFSITNPAKLEVETISSTNKHSVAVHTDQYDALTISAGQDNLGKILLAILSFKRLKNKYPNEYKGGILLIDEIESTLHPSAQKMLIKRIYKYAKDYKIQFIFTTHSPSIISAAFQDKYKKDNSQLLYLKKTNEHIEAYSNPDINNVIAELSGEVVDKKKKINKVEIFCEDIVASKILRNLLSGYKKYFKISNCSLGAEEYMELIRVGLQPITESILILDGDKRDDKNIKKKIASYKAENVIFLPSCYCPEKMCYFFLHDLKEDDSFWDNSLGGFDKGKCFLGYPVLTDSSSTDEFKNWFNNVNNNFGKDLSKLLNY